MGEAGAQGWGLRGPDAGFIGFGGSRIAAGDLDARLAANGRPTFGRTPLAPTFGGYWRLSGGATVGGEWHGLLFEEAQGIGLGGGYGTLGVGYTVTLSRRARVYRRLGVGLGGVGLWTAPEGASIGFDEALTDPKPAPDCHNPWPNCHSSLGREGVVVDLGAGAELDLSGRTPGPMLGLRLGYLVMPSPTDWRLNNQRVVHDGPDATLTGPYARIMVGWTR